ncbi:MAG: hypothetical protein Q8Q32_02945 [bacterium]|nr:hypothetical protein [bacterium]
MLDKNQLEQMYAEEGKSMQEIADLFGCSLNKVRYWMDRLKIKRRSISDAIYLRSNPNGDPFKFNKPKTIADVELLGLGLGLYWGEGTKASKSSVRLGNTDPKLILKFVEFLERIFSVNRGDMKFGLQIFSDISPKKALDFWAEKLRINKSQFYKVIVTQSGSIGTYRKKSEYGVLTVYYNNTRLRDMLVDMLPT